MKYLCCADLHLTDRRPDCRLEDEDWMAVLEAKLSFMAAEAKRADAVIIAGDLFDLWGSVRFDLMNKCLVWFNAIRNNTRQGKIYSIAGNHDCPNHSYEPQEINRSPYLTLVRAGILHDLHLEPIPEFCSCIYTNKENVKGEGALICVAHRGLYLDKKPFPTAPDSGNVREFVQLLPRSVKCVVAGDYHTPFIAVVNGVTIINCGTLLRRRADQMDFKPSLWLLDSDSMDVEKIPVPIVNRIRRDYIDDARETRQMLEEMVGGIDGTFEVVMDYRDNFTRMAGEMPDGDRMIELFNRMTERK